MRRPSFSLKGALALPLASLLAACTVGPNFSKPKLDLPPQFTEKPATPTEIALTDAELTRWWQSFNDPVLNRLVNEAITGNLDLQIARDRLVQARQQKIEAAAGALPQIDFGAQYSRDRSSTELVWPPGVGNYQYYQLGFDASWELDIFGENRRATEAAGYNVDATIAERRALLVSLLSELATDYATLRSGQDELAIAESNVKTAQDVLSYAENLETQGLGTTVAVLQARTQLEQTQSTLPHLRAGIAVMAHAIAVLLGRYPGDLEAMLTVPQPLMVTPATLPDSVPSDVIANRPDVHAALMQYAAANAQIGVAIAAELPHFAIPLTLTPQASLASTLFEGAALTFTAAIEGSQHLYAGGKLNAKIREARAVADEAQLSYKSAVLSALQQVEDALIRVMTERQTNASLVASVKDAEKALGQSTELYHAGLTDFLTVLTDERTVFAARDEVAQSDLALVTDYVSLYKALGGGWQQIELDTPDTTEKK
ncbi:efflux transporter outer membrane subunit [Acidisoma cellulosilytica]|uniref:Efflux transporter outer membrane subunit n=1 Tax=Acidisoma cellulosilyticum TaxID=2802395 RepID=A0A963Z4D4_9PROT|nr:efflux transporter outer membrane subunit [Acidisoma cellulosilyticum]MCB8881810.1 efflux transporter outer membrane subunit [Acidisoma cellulosilyticum]